MRKCCEMGSDSQLRTRMLRNGKPAANPVRFQISNYVPLVALSCPMNAVRRAMNAVRSKVAHDLQMAVHSGVIGSARGAVDVVSS